MNRWIFRIPIILALGAASSLGAGAYRTYRTAKSHQLLQWKPYSRQHLADAATEDRPVLVFFTAEWDLACKQFSRDLREHQWTIWWRDFETIRVDLTDGASNAAWEMLRSLGPPEIPTVAIYDVSGNVTVHKGDSIQVAQVLTDIREAAFVSPLRPIWPGFLIDTLFYGVLWFGMIVGFGAVRRAIRRQRGRCLNCGYDLRGHADHGQDGRAAPGGGCPECGWGRA